jgi:hypothetical protein
MQLGIKQLASGELELVLGDWRFVAKRQAQSRRATLSTDDGLLIDLEGLSLLDVVGEARRALDHSASSDGRRQVGSSAR